MVWCRSFTRAAAVRWLAAAASAFACAPGTADGLTATLANGQSLSVVESSNPDRIGFSFERRYPDGTRDRQFGPGGRVPFEMGRGGVPTKLRTDPSGHILVAGAVPHADRSRTAAVFRFRSTGELDSLWGEQGQVRLPVAGADSVATDILPRSDGSLLIVGTVDRQGSQQASIWRVTPSGHADPQFGQQGAMLAAPQPMTQVLSIQQTSDGALLIAVQTFEGGKSWIEVHRWRAGDTTPLRLARQEQPGQWVGPAALALRDGQWVWLDASQPASAVAVAMLKQPESPWVQAALPSTTAAEPVPSSGDAAVNPYAGAAPVAPGPPARPVATALWLATAAAGVLGLGVLIWWRARRRRD